MGELWRKIFSRFGHHILGLLRCVTNCHIHHLEKIQKVKSTQFTLLHWNVRHHNLWYEDKYGFSASIPTGKLCNPPYSRPSPLEWQHNIITSRISNRLSAVLHLCWPNQTAHSQQGPQTGNGAPDLPAEPQFVNANLHWFCARQIGPVYHGMGFQLIANPTVLSVPYDN